MIYFNPNENVRILHQTTYTRHTNNNNNSSSSSSSSSSNSYYHHHHHPTVMMMSRMEESQGTGPSDLPRLPPPPQHQQQQQHHVISSLLPLPRRQAYRDVQAAGLPVLPLEFPTPIIYRAQIRSQQYVVLDDRSTISTSQSRSQPPTVFSSRSTGTTHSSSCHPIQHHDNDDDVTLLCRMNTTTTTSTTSSSSSSSSEEYAYWMKHPIPTLHQNIYLGIVVVRRHPFHATDTEQDHNPTTTTIDENQINQWRTTNEMVFIKTTANSTYNLRSIHGNSSSSTSTEAACLQLIGNYHTNILGCIEVLQTDDNLYVIMPYVPNSCTLESFLQHRPTQPVVPPVWNTMRPPTHSNNIRGRNPLLQRSDPIQSTTEILSSDYSLRTVSSEGTLFTNDDNTSTGTSTMFTVYEKEDSNSSSRKVPVMSPHESKVRLLFLQLLEALQHLQRKGVSHRNISPSTILMVETDHVSGLGSFHTVLFTDFTNAVRVPYKDDSNVGGIADVSQGSNRLLIKNNEYRTRPTRSPSSSNNVGNIAATNVTNDVVPRSSTNSRSPRMRRYHSTTLSSSSPSHRHYPTSSKKAPSSSSSSIVSTSHVPNRKSSPTNRYRSPFMAPELAEGQPYDGYTVDLWSVGVLMYVMLIGNVPFQSPNITSDVMFRQINLGQLKLLIKQQRTMNGTLPHPDTISDEVIDLLQNLFWYDPSKRLTLHEVLMHPWIKCTQTLHQPQFNIK